MSMRPFLFGALLVAPLACRAPRHPQSLIRFETARGVELGFSSEYGIFALAETFAGETELPFLYEIGNGSFEDVASVQIDGELLKMARARSSRPSEVRLAERPAQSAETLFLEIRPAPKEPQLIEGRLYNSGQSGDLLEIFDQDVEEIARRWRGAPVHVLRNGHYQVIGMLNGLYCRRPDLLTFIGLDELYLMTPQATTYLDRRALPRRADFEYGIPRDIDHEISYGAGAETEMEPPPAEQGTDVEVPTDVDPSKTPEEDKADDPDG